MIRSDKRDSQRTSADVTRVNIIVPVLYGVFPVVPVTELCAVVGIAALDSSNK